MPGHEVTESVAFGVSLALTLAAEARRNGQAELEKMAQRFHETFQEIAVLIGVDMSDLAGGVFDRLDALEDAPDQKQ